MSIPDKQSLDFVFGSTKSIPNRTLESEVKDEIKLNFAVNNYSTFKGKHIKGTYYLHLYFPAFRNLNFHNKVAFFAPKIFPKVLKVLDNFHSFEAAVETAISKSSKKQ